MAVFNRQDGDLAMGTKTPISLLQEIMHKKGLIPQYELIYNGGTLQPPIYKFQVTAETMTAVGEGKSKKEAKHDAAKTLLNRLLNRDFDGGGRETVAVNSIEVDIASPYTGSIKTNCVGKLDEICFLNKIPIANFGLVSEEGPPHARIFTMMCNVGKLSEVAVARTKKQGKHLVAQKMIDRIEKILKNRFVPALENEEPSEEIVSNQEKIRNGSFHHDLSMEVKNLHNAFHLRLDEIPLPPIFLGLPEKSEEFYESTDAPIEFLEQVVDALEGIVERIPITMEELKSSFDDLADKFEDDMCGLVQKNEDFEIAGDEFENVPFVLPDFPMYDEEDEKPTESSVDNGNVEDCVEGVRKIEIVDDFLPVYSVVKVEIPIGLWTFVGRGRNDEEASEQAAREALKFLRTMAIPPPNEFEAPDK